MRTEKMIICVYFWIYIFSITLNFHRHLQYFFLDKNYFIIRFYFPLKKQYRLSSNSV